MVQTGGRHRDISEKFTRDIIFIRLASVIKSTANSMDEYRNPREKCNIIWMARF